MSISRVTLRPETTMLSPKVSEALLRMAILWCSVPYQKLFQPQQRESTTMEEEVS